MPAVGLVASLAGEQELDIKELAVVLCPVPGGDDVTVASSGQLRRKAGTFPPKDCFSFSMKN